MVHVTDIKQNDIQDVYDLTVDDTNCFKLKSGVYAHNSELQDMRISRFDDGIRVYFDYAQMEVRVLAAIADETMLKKAFEDGKDIHRFIASKIYDKPESEISDGERKNAKQSVFALLYGKSVYNFAKDTFKGDTGKAQKLFDDFFNGFPNIKKFVNKKHEEAFIDGRIISMFGDPLIVGMPEFALGLTDKEKALAIKDPYSDDYKLSSDKWEDSSMKKKIGQALRNAQNYGIQHGGSTLAAICIEGIVKFIKGKNLSCKVDCFTHDSATIDTQIKDLPYLLESLRHEAVTVPRETYNIPVDIDYAIGVTGNKMLGLSETIINNEKNVLTTKFKGKLETLNLLVEKLEKWGVVVTSSIEKEDEEKVPLEEVFTTKGAYNANAGKTYKIVEGTLDLDFNHTKSSN